jgi:hypothetical protein
MIMRLKCEPKNNSTHIQHLILQQYFLTSQSPPINKKRGCKKLKIISSKQLRLINTSSQSSLDVKVYTLAFANFIILSHGH